MPRLSESLQLHFPRLSSEDNLITGTMKTRPSDFIVDEIPAYQPSGTGEHLFLQIEKEGVSAEQLLIHLAKTLNVKRNDIGVAGLKDRHAITRQWISVPAECESQVSNVTTDGIRVLESRRHQNKLKTGHLHGNRFSIFIRDVLPEMIQHSLSKRDSILRLGIPNYFGDQRFGVNSETLELGEQLLKGESNPQSIPIQKRKFLLRLALSSAQSALFNLVLAHRIREGICHRVLPGDVLQVTSSGGPFVSTDTQTDQHRFDQREVVTSGPLFGPKMKMPVGVAAEIETQPLSEHQLTLADFQRFKKLTTGTRRPLLLWLDQLNVAPTDNGLLFQFSLPAGAYATVVMREFLADEPQR